MLLRGWIGCEPLFVGQLICLSKGNPPLPAPMSNAVCGPTKPGTKAPPAGVDFVTLNPCPLKACCNIWGSCGTFDSPASAARGYTNLLMRYRNNKRILHHFQDQDWEPWHISTWGKWVHIQLRYGHCEQQKGARQFQEGSVLRVVESRSLVHAYGCPNDRRHR